MPIARLPTTFVARASTAALILVPNVYSPSQLIALKSEGDGEPQALGELELVLRLC